VTKIRVLVVDDSATVRGRLVEILGDEPEFEVVGVASDGRRAVDLCTELRPDVMTLDLALPEMSGLAVTEHVMAHAPTPILIVSSSFNRGEVFDTYEALAAGAVDVLDKTGTSEEADDGWDQRFVAAVRMVSRIKVITHPRGRLGALGRPRGKASSGELAVVPVTETSGVALVALGASTGGPGALADVLTGVPADFALPIVVVLHIDAAFASSFANWLATQTGRAVRCAVDGEVLVPGTVLVAPSHHHIVVRGKRIYWNDAPPRNYCKPSIDVLFESIAADYGSTAMACLLTGMGRDGAAGMLAIRRAGGLTIAQDEATSVVWGMPREAVANGGAARVLPLHQISAAICRTVKP
jgi:two-component system chemotaxis response regulator CheB